MFRAAILVATLALAPFAAAQQGASYNSCVLDLMKGKATLDQVTVAEIRQACIASLEKDITAAASPRLENVRLHDQLGDYYGSEPLKVLTFQNNTPFYVTKVCLDISRPSGSAVECLKQENVVFMGTFMSAYQGAVAPSESARMLVDMSKYGASTPPTFAVASVRGF
jgi:hypothetical protein